MELPGAIRQAALFPESDLLDFPPGHPTRRIEVEGVLVTLLATQPAGLVFPQRVEESRIQHLVDAVRRSLVLEGRERALWMVPEASVPKGLARQLLALGMRPNDQPGAEAREALMICLEEPPPGPPDVVVRPAEDLDEYRAGLLVVPEAFGMDEHARKAFDEQAELLWPFQFETGTVQTFVALVDGEVVAFAGARFGRTTAYLAGGGTRPDHRGRGAYRALVRARWDAAAARGTPALTVSAGAMSRPILERLGFSIVGWSDCLLDELG
jgi:GNAT superfamily N-acetyltransferase